MKLHSIQTGFFKLDGGAMFGVVPKSIWQKSNPADENNMCSWAMRSLLIEDGNRLILIDNGMGDKQDAKFFSYYYLYGDFSLSKSLHDRGFDEKDVTDVFLTHLHFDHCGGGLRRNGEKIELTFPNARYWSNEDHWNWATKPNSREKASFLKENILPMKESGHLQFVDPQAPSPFEQFEIFYTSGHTEKMMVPCISYNGRTVCFVTDLLPSTGHIPLSYVMGYDTRPLLTIEEKGKFLDMASEKDYVLFLQHDPVNECCAVVKTDRGVRLKETFRLSEVG